MVDGGHREFGGHIGKRKFASYSNMKEHIQMNLCAKFHACMIKCTHYPGFYTILLDYSRRGLCVVYVWLGINRYSKVDLMSISSKTKSSCVQGVLVFPLHPARYESVSTYLGPHSRRTHVPLVRHPPSLDIKANRHAPAIRRHRLAWEHQAKWQYTRSDAWTWPTLLQHCDSVYDNGPTLRQHCVLAICEMLFVQPITQL